MSYIIFVDPITFKINKISTNVASTKIKNALDAIASKISTSDPVEAIRKFNEEFYNLLRNEESIFSTMPSDTRFPGFMSSLADHLLMTSAYAVALAEQAIRKNISLAEEYPENSKIHEILNDRKNIKHIIRFAALMHDIGKPQIKHHKETAKIVKDLLIKMNFDQTLASSIAQMASRHHYGKKYEDSEKPHTRVEWIIAYADKLSVQDRSMIPKRPIETKDAFNWLKANTKNLGNKAIKSLIEVAEFFDKNASALEKGKVDRNLVPDALVEKDLVTKLRMENELSGENRINLGKKPLAILLLETSGIQSFISRSEALKYLQGSSALLEEAINRAAEVIGDMLAPETIIYVGGGALLAIVPAEGYNEILSKAIDAFRKVAGEQVSLKKVPKEAATFSMFDIKNGLLPIWQEWTKTTQVDLRDLVLISPGFIYKYLTINSIRQSGKIPEFSTKPNDVCEICYSEPPHKPNNMKRYLKIVRRFEPDRTDLSIGESCYNVLSFQYDVIDEEKHILSVKKGSCNINKPKFKIGALETLYKAIKILCEKLPDLGVEKVEYEVSHFNDIYSYKAGNSEKASYPLAVIAGDGDNFGSIKEEMTNFTLLKYISDKFKMAIQDTLAKTLADILVEQIKLNNKNGSKSINLKLPFRLIYVGGDDFLLALDPRAIPKFIVGLRRYMNEFFGEATSKYKKSPDEPLSRQFLGISMGITIGKTNSPLFLMLESVRALESEAKRYSKTWQARNKPLFGSEITVAMHRFANVPNKQEIVDKYTKIINKYSVTGWPRIGAEIIENEGIFDITKKLLKRDIKANTIKNYLDLNEQNIIGIDIVLNYAAARLKNDKKKSEGYLILNKAFFSKYKDIKNAIITSDLHEIMKIINDDPLFLEGL